MRTGRVKQNQKAITIHWRNIERSLFSVLYLVSNLNTLRRKGVGRMAICTHGSLPYVRI